MIKYNVKEFGELIQESNKNQIIVISWSTEDNGVAPEFYFFDDVQSIIDYFKESYMSPFVIGDIYYTKRNAILRFNDENLEIELTAYKNETDVYKFFKQDEFFNIKNLLSQGSLTADEFKMQLEQ